MAEVVGVHGILNQFKGPHSLHKDWEPALWDGLRAAGCDKTPELTCAFYGDLFRRPGTKASGPPPLEASDVDAETEGDLLLEWWRTAAQSEPGRVAHPDSKTKARTPAIFQRALSALLRSSFFAAFAGRHGERALVFALRQVRLYLHDPKIRSAARQRVAACISADTRVVVGHSLGSVVAYEVLCDRPGDPLPVFVTLGSPLGIRPLVFDRLAPTPEGDRGAWPRVERWCNVADGGDLVALTKELDPLFPSEAGVDDRPVHNGWQSHDVCRYLTARETGAAVASAL